MLVQPLQDFPQASAVLGQELRRRRQHGLDQVELSMREGLAVHELAAGLDSVEPGVEPGVEIGQGPRAGISFHPYDLRVG